MTRSVQTSVETPVGFADGEVIALERSGQDLIVTVRAWNNKRLEVRFQDVIGFRESLAGEISDLVYCEGAGELWAWSTGRAYEQPPGASPEFVYRFMDHNDDVSLEVVARSVGITVKGS